MDDISNYAFDDDEGLEKALKISLDEYDKVKPIEKKEEKSEKGECQICCNNAEIIKCGCGYCCCFDCFDNWFKNFGKLECPKCRGVWDIDYTLENIPNALERFTEYRKQILFNRENININKKRNYLYEVGVVENDINENMSLVKDLLENIENKKLELKSIRANYARETYKCPKCDNIINIRNTIKIKTENNETELGICETCHLYYCIKCYTLLENFKNEENFEPKNHVCDPNSLEDIEMIKKLYKPCPCCLSSIEHLEGCNQMWCTNCNTAFNWDTLEIIHKDIDNPHFNAFISAVRNPLDTTCGDLPDSISISSKINFTKKYLCLITINNKCRGIQEVIEKYRRTINDNDMDSLYKDYIFNKINTIKFKEQLYETELNKTILRAELEIYELYVNVVKENMLNIVDLDDTDIELYKATIEETIDIMKQTAIFCIDEITKIFKKFNVNKLIHINLSIFDNIDDTTNSLFREVNYNNMDKIIQSYINRFCRIINYNESLNEKNILIIFSSRSIINAMLIFERIDDNTIHINTMLKNPEYKINDNIFDEIIMQKRYKIADEEKINIK